jgi:ribonuclease HI
MSLQDETIIVYADGGSRGNPGPAGIGAALMQDGKLIAGISEFIGIATNNVAEYKALIAGLKHALKMGYVKVEVRMDSELVVRQILGQYKVKNENLKPLFMEAKLISNRFQSFAINHVRRELNKDADRLANEAMDKANTCA